MNRTPPDEVKFQLRREVNFGCPVHGCGSPFLTFHHFDPPWSKRQHHDLAGMVALCKVHHDAADGGAYSVSQLRALKSRPFVQELAKGTWAWEPEHVVFFVGPCVQFGALALRAGGEVVLRARRCSIRDTEAIVSFDARIRDASGCVVLAMVNNEISADTERLADLRCSVQQHDIALSAPDGVELGLRVDRWPMGEFERQVRSRVWDGWGTGRDARPAAPSADDAIAFAKRHCLDSDGLVPTVQIRALLWAGGWSLRLDADRFEFRQRDAERWLRLPPSVHLPLDHWGVLDPATGRQPFEIG